MNKTLFFSFTILFAFLNFASCEPQNSLPFEKPATSLRKIMNDETKIPEGSEIITLGGGCYWCIEAVFQQLEGVHSVVSGFMGGHVKNPTYEAVTQKKTGHIEVIQVVYDPKKIPLSDLLAWFWLSHDPTTKNRQGNDVGPQYASAIFYHNDEDLKVINASLENAQPHFDKPIVTHVREAAVFYEAPDYHQDYYFQNKNQGYCRYVILPKLEKLKLKK